ncbi:MAG: DUF1565 domain-containing protein [Cyanobacteria bacterium J06623_4]
MLVRYSSLSVAIATGTLLLGPVATLAQGQELAPFRTGIAERTVAGGQHLASRAENTQSASYRTLYVDPEVGSDSADGEAAEPLRTVTRALEVAPPNTVIVLAPGRYTQSSGEVFPLQLKPGVTIQGTPGSSDRTAIIEGGGDFTSPTRSQQNAAILAADRAGIAQVAISNPDGYGVWIESASPTILESAFVGNRQTGIYVAGGSPRVQGSYFSGNQVAGVIVFGLSQASIQRNIFDGTGDAIRVLDGATPEIVGNRITNNDAGLVLIGDARPVLRDNQITGNRRDDVVEVSARSREISSSANLAAEAPLPPVAKIPDPSPDSFDTDVELEEIAPEEIAPEEIEPEEGVLEVPDTGGQDLAMIDSQQPTVDSTEQLDSVDQANDPIPAGAPGAALQALQSGVALGPRAVTEENPDSPGSLLRNRRMRNRRRRRREENNPEPAAIPERPVNNNRLAVPNTSIPLGSGTSSTVFSPPTGGAGAPPAPPSRAQALGLYYRVFVEASDPFVQDRVREVVPDAFRTRFEGRMMMQVGAFPTEEEAEERRELLEDNNFDVRVEYIR